MHVYPEAAQLDSAQFWLGDASGNRIESGDLILMSDPDGSQQSVPWSLSRYFKVRGVKYPSKVKFSLVLKLHNHHAID